MFLSDFPPGDEVVGGEQVRPHEFVRYWAASGRTGEVWCVRTRRRRRSNDGRVKIRSLRLRGVACEFVMLPFAAFVILRAVWHWKRGAQGRPVLVHRPGGVHWIHGLPILGDIGIALIPLCRLTGVVCIASVHDVSPEHELNALRRRIDQGVIEQNSSAATRLVRTARGNAFLQRLGVTGSHLTLATSMQHTEMLCRRSRRISREKFVLVPPGVRPSMFLTRVAKRDRTATWTLGVPGSLFDSDLATLEATIAALPTSHDFCVHFFGRDAELALRWRVPAHVVVRASPMTRYEHFANIANDVDAWLLVWGSDPYFATTSPLRVPMCIASGKPVISTELREFVPAGLQDLLVVVPPDPGVIANAVERVANDPDALKSASANAHLVLENLSWDARFRVIDERLVKLVG